MQLNPKHVTLNGLLQGRLFRIPDYQRAYAWGSKQREDLFSDIREVLKSKQDHFMATIVCLARDKQTIVADEFTVAEVVDGQQRLTTFIILLKAIEKALDSNDKAQLKIRREILDLLVKGDEHALVLLQTNHDSSHVFLDYIRTGKIRSTPVETAADQNLVDAANECEKFVGEWTTGSNLIELVALLRNRLSMIYHELTDEAAVYRVFEVLNSRGLDVRWIDKVKSQLMALIFLNAETGSRAETLKEMHVIWQDIYRILGLRGDLGDEALRFAGTLGAKTRANRLLSEEDAAAAVIENAGTRLKTITNQGRWLKSVVAAVDSLDRNVRLRAVTRIIHARFVAASILLREFPPAVEKLLLGHWERVTFRVFGLGGADTRNKRGEYVRLAYEIIAQQLTEKEIVKQLHALGEGFSIDEVLEEVGWEDSYDGWTEELRYLLFRYDEFLARQANEKINDLQWAKIWAADPSKSIEHIKPQSSGVGYLHHLGNLTMLPPSVNSSLQDKPPKQKAATYKDCGIRGTAEVADIIRASNWDEKAVLARAKKIEKFVRNEWAA